MKMRQEYTCPLEIVHDIVKGKWKTIIIFQLRKGNRTFSELEHTIEGMSEKMLLQQLKELREFDLIDKISTEGYPLHVEYFLTGHGQKLLQAVEIMQELGIEYMLEHGGADILLQKGILYSQSLPTKK